MRTLLSLILIAISVMAAYSTGQYTEDIIDNGVSKGMATLLLESDSATFALLRSRLPERFPSTALYRKYVGCWEIKNDSLFLDSVLIMNPTSQTPRFSPLNIDDIYASRRTGSRYFADWVTDTLRIVSGDIVRDDFFIEWSSDWEHEEYVTVVNGLLKNRTVYENRLVNSFENNKTSWFQAFQNVDFGDFSGRIILKAQYTEFNDKGYPTQCDLSVLRGSGDSNTDVRIAEQAKKILLQDYLLPIYYIRGHYKSDMLNIPLDGKKSSTGQKNEHK